MRVGRGLWWLGRRFRFEGALFFFLCGVLCWVVLGGGGVYTFDDVHWDWGSYWYIIWIVLYIVRWRRCNGVGINHFLGLGAQGVGSRVILSMRLYRIS